MTQSEVKTARIIFYVAAIVGAIYGLLFLSMPERVLELSHDPGVPTDPAWVRWSGGVLIGIALAAWLAAQKPNKQTPLVVGLVLTYLLVALSLLYSIISGEYRGAQWFIWLRILIDVGLFAAMVWLLIRLVNRARPKSLELRSALDGSVIMSGMLSGLNRPPPHSA